MGTWFGTRQTGIADEIDAIRADLRGLVDRISRLSAAASSSVRDAVPTLDDARGRLGKAAHGAIDQGRDWLDTAGDDLRHGVTSARGAVERNPLVGIAVAAGIGFLIGLSVRR